MGEPVPVTGATELEMGKRIFFQEIGDLSPGKKPQWVVVTVALPEIDRAG